MIGSAATVISDNPAYYRMSKVRRAVRYAFGARAPGTVKAIRSALAAADVVVASGGDVFSSDHGVAFLRRQLNLLIEAEALGKKTVFPRALHRPVQDRRGTGSS